MDRVSRRDFHKSRNYYLAVASEWAGPLLRAIGSVTTGPASSRETWRRGLIIGHTHIGDVLYRTASLDQLAAGTPECHWDYLAAPESAPVLNGNPAIARTFPFVAGENSWDLADGAFATLRSQRYDVALCSNTLRHYPDLALAVALGIPNRAGYSNHGLSGLITHPIQITRPLPYPAYFAEMVKQLCGLERDWPIRPKVVLDARHHNAANAFVNRFAMKTGALVICSPGSRQPRGVWPDQLFVDSLNALSKQIEVNVILCGGAGERTRLENTARGLRMPNAVMAGELDLLSFGALLTVADVVLAQDSGSRHLGNAVGASVVFLRNLSFDPVEAGKYCDSEDDVAPPGGPVRPEDLKAVQSSVSADAVAERIIARIGSTGR